MKKIESVRIKLFTSLCVVVILIVLFLVAINRVVLEEAYMYSKIYKINNTYEKIEQLYSKNNGFVVNLEDEIDKLIADSDQDVLIINNQDELIYSSNKNLRNSVIRANEIISKDKIQNVIPNKKQQATKIVYQKDNIVVRKITDEKNDLNNIFLTATLQNGNQVYIKVSATPIQESVQISNRLLILIGGVAIIIAGIIASIISRIFTKRLTELDDIANKMSKLDFSKKYNVTDSDDEINNLGRSINTMSDKLERTINQLRETNKELEKDIEEKSKIDEMRKQFISDVSHELKTPIALIQGYAEGLVENVNSDEESRKFYAEVILDETEKMDALVKQLLELMKLEYGNREFNNTNFDIVELIKEVIRKCDVMIKEKDITIEFEEKQKVEVVADPFYIEQVITNYLTNAIKHAEQIGEDKKIVITINEKKNNKVRINVFNTGKNIPEMDLDRVWKRFYKLDSSRNREDGGSGIGLAIVKAIMNNYKNGYGVTNKENGVEFYFELDK